MPDQDQQTQQEIIKKLEADKKRLEEGLSGIKLTPNPEALNELRKLSESSSDLLHSIIPNKVREEMDKILSSFSAEFRLLTDSLRKLAGEVEKSNSEIFYSLEEVDRMAHNIKRLEERIDEIHLEFRSARKPT